MRRLVLVLAVALLPACAKKPSSGLKPVSDALVAAGFRVDGFHAVDPARFGARACASGPLDGVEALLCDLGAPADATIRKAGEDWIAQAPTGVVLARGQTLLALADRAHADPNGRTIHKVTQLYQRVQ